MDISLKRVLAGFKLANEAEGLSPKTIRWYDNNLGLFYRWARKRYKREPVFKDITAEDIRAYLNDLRTSDECYEEHPYTPRQKRKISASTIAGYYASLSSLCNWAVREEIIDRSPVRNVPRPKIPRFLPDPFSEDEVKRMLEAAKKLDEKMAVRMTAILHVMLDTGLRLTELLNMELKNLDMDQGRALIMGKGAKQRYIFFGKVTKKSLWRYLSFARPEPMAGAGNVFLTHDGRPIPKRRLAAMLKDIGTRSGVQNVHPHRFRRYAAIACLRAGMGELFLAKMLGHEDTSLLRVYVAALPDDVQAAHKTASPVDTLGV